jgi:ActR/RegA family two-component response regulator
MTNKERMLFVDDDQDFLGIIERIFHGKGMTSRLPVPALKL